MAKCYFCSKIEMIKNGTALDFLVELKESYAILSDAQRFKGYVILVSKKHDEHFHKMSSKRQEGMFKDLMRVTLAIGKVFKPARFNYENLGNITPHVHWHIIPRYKNDPDRRQPIWVIPENARTGKVGKAKRLQLLRVLKGKHYSDK